LQIRLSLRKARKRLQYAAIPPAAWLRSVAVSTEAPKVFANSLPKSGTNLTKRMLGLLPAMSAWLTYHLEYDKHWESRLRRVAPGQIVTAHFKYCPEIAKTLTELDFKVLLTVRDPRDVAVSNAYYITYMDRSHRLHPYFRALPSDEERIAASIRGIEAQELPDGKHSKSIGEHVEGYLSWADHDRCMLVRFEDLIGESGGGDTTKQQRAIEQVAAHVGLPQTQNQVERIAARCFSSKSRTFRKGRVGGWQTALSEKNKKLFKEVAGEQLIALGYEADFNW